jgi:hypothetical protein
MICKSEESMLYSFISKENHFPIIIIIIMFFAQGGSPRHFEDAHSNRKQKRESCLPKCFMDDDDNNIDRQEMNRA